MISNGGVPAGQGQFHVEEYRISPSLVNKSVLNATFITSQFQVIQNDSNKIFRLPLSGRLMELEMEVEVEGRDSIQVVGAVAVPVAVEILLKLNTTMKSEPIVCTISKYHLGLEIL